MKTIKTYEYPSYTTSAEPRASMSWLGILVGAATCVAVAGCLGLLGIGLGAVHVPAGGVLGGITARASIWLIITGAIAFYSGGYVSSHIAGLGRAGESVVHGLGSWAAATVFLLSVAPMIGMLFNGTGITLSAAAAGRFGAAGFFITLIDGIAACIGAYNGTSLFQPVPVERYMGVAVRTEEPVVSNR